MSLGRSQRHILDTRKRAESWDLLLAVTALGAHTAEREPAEVEALCSRVTLGANAVLAVLVGLAMIANGQPVTGSPTARAAPAPTG